jgi:hypothetical protein
MRFQFIFIKALEPLSAGDYVMRLLILVPIYISSFCFLGIIFGILSEKIFRKREISRKLILGLK